MAKRPRQGNGANDWQEGSGNKTQPPCKSLDRTHPPLTCNQPRACQLPPACNGLGAIQWQEHSCNQVASGRTGRLSAPRRPTGAASAGSASRAQALPLSAQGGGGDARRRAIGSRRSINQPLKKITKCDGNSCIQGRPPISVKPKDDCACLFF